MGLFRDDLIPHGSGAGVFASSTMPWFWMGLFLTGFDILSAGAFTLLVCHHFDAGLRPDSPSFDLYQKG